MRCATGVRQEQLDRRERDEWTDVRGARGAARPAQARSVWSRSATSSGAPRLSSRGRPRPSEYLPAHLGGESPLQPPVLPDVRTARGLGVGYWAWCTAPTVGPELSDAWLIEQIRRIPRCQRRSVRQPAVHAMTCAIRGSGRREAHGAPDALSGLQGAHQRRRKGCTIRVPGVEPFADLVARDFRQAGQPRVVRGHQADPHRRGLAVLAAVQTCPAGSSLGDGGPYAPRATGSRAAT